MPWDEMPDALAAKHHEDRRYHGEVSAVTMSNSPTYVRNHGRIAWHDIASAKVPTEDEEAAIFVRLMEGEPVHETRRFADNFDRIFGKKD